MSFSSFFAPHLPRFGNGFDVHALIPQAHGVLRLGGIDIPFTHVLDGHSDADVVLHALTDALLATGSLGDIGDLFPPSDPQWKGQDSAFFLKAVLTKLNELNLAPYFADVTVLAEAPKLYPYKAQMKHKLAKLLELPENAVSLKATTTEKLGFVGRQEGIACLCTVSVASSSLLHLSSSVENS